MKNFKFKIEGEDFKVSVNESDRNIAEVTVNGKPYIVEVEREEAPVVKRISKKTPPKAHESVKETKSQKKPGGAKSIKSPLPGNILKVIVNAGQTVKRGDLLVIIESMKMENNILADRDGTVTSVYVQPGQSVLQGDALIDLDS